MDLVLFSAIPKVALFFLLLVGAAIIAEVIYLAKKKMDSPEVTLPKSLQNLPGQKPLVAPAMVAMTTEVIAETPRKSRLTRKKTVIIISTLLVALTIPVGLALVKQRQVVRKEAAVYPSTEGINKDTCNYFTFWASEPSSCSSSTKTYQNTYYIKNTTDSTHTLEYFLSSYFCPEGLGEPRGTGGAYWCTKNEVVVEQRKLISVGPHQTVSVPIERTSPGSSTCGSFQADITILSIDGGTSCVPTGGSSNVAFGFCQTKTDCVTPTPTPTPTPAPQCSYVRAYDSNWQQITDLSKITIGQAVYFAAKGQGQISSITFRINNGAAQVSSNLRNGEFYIQYTVPATGSYTVDATINPGFPPD